MLPVRALPAGFIAPCLPTKAEKTAIKAPNHVERRRRREICVALSRLKELGEQAIVAVAASLVDGGAVLKAQLIASRFYEALRHELEESSSRDEAKRAALIAASDRCERVAAPSINPTALLDELRKAIAVLEDDTHPLMSPPTKARPILRVIEGGLSNV
jgi:hypothetical protein